MREDRLPQKDTLPDRLKANWKPIVRYILSMVMCIITVLTVHHWHVQAKQRNAEEQARFAKYLVDFGCKRFGFVPPRAESYEAPIPVYKCSDDQVWTRDELWLGANPRE